MSKAKVGLVGVGGFGRRIVEAAGKSSTLEPVACYDVQSELARSTAAHLGARACGSYRELLAIDGLKGVMLVLPNDLHRSFAESAAAAGKHIFVEKPLANTVADSRAMIAAARKAGVILEVGHCTRRSGLCRKAKELVAAGALGKVVGLEANFSGPAGFRQTEKTWRYHRSRCPVLPMTQLGVHILDFFIYLVGPVESVSGFARHAAMPGENDDAVVINFQTKSGVLGTLGSYYVTPHVWYFRVLGTEAVLFGPQDKLVLTRNDSEREIPVPDIGIIQEEVDEFGRCILEGKEPETNGESSLESVKVLEAAVISARVGSRVNLSEL